LHVNFEDSLLAVTIRNNGKGFVLGSMSPFGDGLRNMKQRMEDVGGTLEVTSESSKGTEIKIAVPLGEAYL